MKKNVLAMSIAALVGGLGLAGGAAAGVVAMPAYGAGTGNPGSLGTTATVLEFSNSDVGHSLIIPYYTVQSGNATLLSLVNTDLINAKAVKVRFRGAANSDDVFDFQLYLSPGDVWTATVSQGADGLAQLQTNDNSCKLPEFGTSTQSFVTARLPTRLSGATTALTTAQINAQTREGYIEVLNMADILGYPTSTGVFPTAGQYALFNAIKHNASGVPTCDPAVMGAVLTADITTAAFAQTNGLAAPTTGLMGSWAILNVPEAAAWGSNATALVARVGAAGLPGGGNLVFSPQLAGPVAAAQAVTQTADPLFITFTGGTTPLTASQFFDYPDLSTPYTVGVTPRVQARNLTAALAVTSVKNEFATDASISGGTDWVISQPTRRYSVAVDYNTVAPAAFGLATTDIGAAGKADDYYSPITAHTVADGTVAAPTANAGDAAGNVSLVGQQACVSGVSVRHFDRNERTAVPATGSFVISPGTVTPASVLRLCGEVGVITFNGDAANTPVLHGALATFSTTTNVAAGVTANTGWTNIATPGYSTLAPFGLPILGGAFQRATAGTATNPSNFGANWDHRFTR